MPGPEKAQLGWANRAAHIQNQATSATSILPIRLGVCGAEGIRWHMLGGAVPRGLHGYRGEARALRRDHAPQPPPAIQAHALERWGRNGSGDHGIGLQINSVQPATGDHQQGIIDQRQGGRPRAVLALVKTNDVTIVAIENPGEGTRKHRHLALLSIREPALADRNRFARSGMKGWRIDQRIACPIHPCRAVALLPGRGAVEIPLAAGHHVFGVQLQIRAGRIEQLLIHAATPH